MSRCGASAIDDNVVMCLSVWLNCADIFEECYKLIGEGTNYVFAPSEKSSILLSAFYT